MIARSPSFAGPSLARLALVALLGSACVPEPGSARLVIEAGELHVGDGRVIEDALVVVADGRVRSVGPRRRVTAPSGWPRVTVEALTPGLVVAALEPPHAADVVSADPDRFALDLIDQHAPTSPWLARGVTALAITPGDERLMTGSGGLVRLTADGATARQRRGPVHVAWGASALSPPLLYEPRAPVNVDNPQATATPQRPSSTAEAMAELRRLLGEARRGRGSDALQRVVGRRTALRVRAESDDDIRRALALAEEFRLRLVIEGGVEAWKVADELADARAAVVLALPEPGHAPPHSSLDDRPDAAAILAAAGVDVALALRRHLDGDWSTPSSPLLLAAAQVRQGLPLGEAVASVTSRAAAAMGAPGLGTIRVGAPADLVAFDGPPLATGSRTIRTWVGGESTWSRPEAEPEFLVLSAGTIHHAGGVLHDGHAILRGDQFTGASSGTALPAGASVRDFGSEAVIVPGFVDAFTHVGLQPGDPPAGSARTVAADAVELDHPSLHRALTAGVTTALVAPDTGGILRGMASLVSTAPDVVEDDDSERDAPGPLELDVIAAKAGLVFVLDGGPADEGARAGRVKALQGLLNKAKQYHGAWEKAEKPKKKNDKDQKGKRSRRREEESKPAKPEKVEELEPYRDLFRDKTRAFLRAGRHDSIIAGLDAFKRAGVKPILVGGEEADLVADELAKRGIPVILGPSMLRSEKGEIVNVAARLRAAGVAVAFGSLDHAGAALLPIFAARAVHHGLSPVDALSALTLGRSPEKFGAPAKVSGLDRGGRADLTVFSGDPFEPTSRVLAVVVRGEIVHEWGDDVEVAGQ